MNFVPLGILHPLSLIYLFPFSTPPCEKKMSSEIENFTFLSGENRDFWTSTGLYKGGAQVAY